MAEMLFPESGGRLYRGGNAVKKEGTHRDTEGEFLAAAAALCRRNAGNIVQFLCHRQDEHCGCLHVK